MYRYGCPKMNTITEEIESLLMKLQLAQANQQAEEISAFTLKLEGLLQEYKNLRQENKHYAAL